MTSYETTAEFIRANPPFLAIAIGVLCVGIFIILPLLLYWTYCLFRKRNDVILRKRHADLSLYLVACIIIQTIIIIIFCLYGFGIASSVSFVVAGRFLVTVNMVNDGLTAAFLATRLWLVYFETKLTVLLSADKWKNVIDEKLRTKSDWFLSHRKSFGNTKNAKRALLVFFVVSCILCTTIIMTEDIVLSTVWVLVFCFIVVFFLVTHSRFKAIKFYDDLHITQEVTMLVRLFWISAIMLICTIIAAVILLYATTGNDPLSPQSSACIEFITTIGTYTYSLCIVYILTLWVLRKLANDPVLHVQYGDISAVSKQKTVQLDPAALSQDNLTQAILTQNNWFEAMMNHLANEFSSECLLSLVEFIQFKQAFPSQMIPDRDADDSDSKQPKWHTLQLAECIPQSSIVTCQTNDFQAKALQLYQKYVAESSEWEINIPSGCRKQLYCHFHQSTSNTCDNDVLYTIFDRCCDEMISLIRHSFRRFKTKPEYQRLLKLKKKPM